MKKFQNFIMVLFLFYFIFMMNSCEKKQLNSEKNTNQISKQSQTENSKNTIKMENFKRFNTDKFSIYIPKNLKMNPIKDNKYSGKTYTWGDGKNGLYIQIDYFKGNGSLSTKTWVKRFKQAMGKRKAVIVFDKPFEKIKDARFLKISMKLQNLNISSYTIMTKKGDTFYMFQFIINDKEENQFIDTINKIMDTIEIK